MRLIEVRDIRTKEKYSIDDAYLNGYARILKPTATAIYNSLCRHADLISQSSFPSLKLLAEEHGISIKSAQRSIKKLRDWNIIAYEQIKNEKGKWLRNKYILLDKKLWKLISAGQKRPTDNRRTFSTPPVGQNRPSKDIHIKKDIHIYKEIYKERVLAKPSLERNGKRHSRYNTLDSLTPQVFLEIALQYKVSPAFVRLQFEKMKNWLEATGKTKKNYKAQLRNFVLGDLEKKAERRSYGASKVSIDTTQL